MTITIESTTKIVTLEMNGKELPARVWEGKTDSEIDVICFITRIAVASEENTEQFDKELQQCRPPSAAIEAFPARLIL